MLVAAAARERLTPRPSALTSDSLRRMLGGDCCELLRRPVMVLNLAAASIDGAGRFAPILQEKLPAVAALLQKEPLGEAIRYFNLSRDVERGRDESMQMGQTLLKHVRRTVRHEQPLLAEAAEAAAAWVLWLYWSLELPRRTWHGGANASQKRPNNRNTCKAG